MTSNTLAPALRHRLRAAEFALPAILFILIVVFSVARPDVFFTASNLRGIVLTQSVLAILALGAMFPLIVGDFDLSIAGNLGLGGILVTGLPSMSGVPLIPALIIALVACTLVGLINGILVHVLQLNAFIATLATGLILGGLTNWYTQSQIIFKNIPEELPAFGRAQLLGIPYPVIAVALIAIASWYFLQQTPAGRYFYAVGGSREAARLSGLNVPRLGISAFMISGLLAGVAGVLEAAVIGTGNPTVGGSFLLPAFAAVFLGATTIKIGRFNSFGTMIAVVTIAVGVAGLQLVGLPFYIEPIFNGGVLVLGVLAIKFLRGAR